MSSVWVSGIHEEDERKVLVYRLTDGDYVNTPPDGSSEAIKGIFKTYCESGALYAKLNSDYCKLMGLEYPVFLSLDFIKAARMGDGTYPWQKVRGPDHAAIVIDNNKRADELEWIEFVKCLEQGDRGVKSRARGGYIIPGREGNGNVNLFVISDSFKAFYEASAWKKLFKACTSIVEGWSDGAAFRAINPPDLTLIIQPFQSDFQLINGAYKTVNGVSWDVVETLFERLLETDSTIQTKYEFEFPQGANLDDYECLSVNPFCHYETWIRRDQLDQFFLVDRPMPDPAPIQNNMVTALQELSEQMYLTKKYEAEAFGFIDQGALVTWNLSVGIVPLSAEKIIKSAGKRKGTRSQTAVMSASAPEIARQLFGWDPNRNTPFHIAEWLHLSAFSFGGLVEGDQDWNTSQTQLNLIFGTSETNSVMLRYEKAWQELFKLEYNLREELQKAGLGDYGAVLGELIYHNNADLDVKHTFTNPNTQQRGWQMHPFNGSVAWERYWDICQWFSLALDWDVRMFSKSLLLDWDEPRGSVHFSPFARPFFTKGETLMDTLLLKKLFDDRINAAQAQLQTVVPEQMVLETEVTAIKAEAIEISVAEEVEENADFGLRSVLSNSGEQKQEVLFDLPEELSVAEPQGTLDTTPETTMSSWERKLTEADNVEHLESVDSFINSISDHLNFRSEFQVPMPSPTSAEDNLHAGVFSNASVVQFDSLVADTAGTHSGDTIVVGGIRVHNPSLVVCTAENMFAEIPVIIHAVPGPATEEALLLTPSSQRVASQSVESADSSTAADSISLEKPILLLSAAARADVEVRGRPLFDIKAVEKVVSRAFDGDATVRTATLSAYTLSTDLREDLFGIPGLRGKLHTAQDMDPDAPVWEMVQPDFSGMKGGPLGKLFPYVENDILQQLPIDNVRFLYTEDRKDLTRPSGLRIEGDVEFTGPLQPIADVLAILFGDGDSKPPSGLHLEACLSQERDWKCMPTFSSFALRGSSVGGSVSVGEWFKFTTIGVEVSATRVVDIGSSKSNWAFGYGLFGELEIHKVPGMGFLPINVGYRIKKTGDYYTMGMTVDSDGFDGLFGVTNLKLRRVELSTQFSAKSIRESISVAISGFMTLGKTEIYLAGGYSKAESYLEAEIGNMTWAEVVQAYHDIMGDEVTADTQGNDIKFEKISLRVSTKGFSLAGSVTFNGRTSVAGLVSFGESGLLVQGGIGDYHVEDAGVTIKKAGFDIFVGAKASGGMGRQNRFAIHGEVEFEGVTIKAHLYTSSDGTSKPRQWFVYGEVEGDVRASTFSKALEGSDLDKSLVLRNAALVATNMDKPDRSVNPFGYPASKGLSLCALISTPETIQKLAGKQQAVDGLSLAFTVTTSTLKLGIHTPPSMTVDLGDSAQLGNLTVGVELSKEARFLLAGDLTFKMPKGQSPLVVEVTLFAGMVMAGIAAKTKTSWRNPFGISDKVEVRSLGVDLKFDYISGPAEFGVFGGGVAGDIACEAAMAVSKIPDHQLLKFEISKIKVAQVIGFVGDLVDCQALREVSAEGDFLVFTDAKMYFSTGVTIAGEKFPAGISAGGTMEIFGKKASFDALVGKSGISFNGKVDNFHIGPLEVGSASGGPQAVLRIAMTTDEQLIYIDGMIVFLSLKLKVFVETSLKPLKFNVDIEISLTEKLSFRLKGEATNVSNPKDLSKANMTLTAELRADVLGFICDGVIDLLNHLQDLVDGGVDALEFSLHKRSKELTQERDAVRQQLAAAKASFDLKRAEQEKQTAALLAEQAAARKELDDLERALSEGKITDADEKAAAQRRVDEAKQRRQVAYNVKSQEYQRQLADAQNERDRQEDEKRKLEDQKTSQFGKTIEDLKKALNLESIKWAIVEPLRRDYREAEEKFERGNLLEKSYLCWNCAQIWARLEVAEAALNTAQAYVARLRAILDSPEFKALVAAIEKAVKFIEKAVRAIGGLLDKGLDGFTNELLRDEDAEIAAQEEKLQMLLDANSEYQKAIREAQAKLDAKKPNLLEIITRCDQDLRNAQGDMVITGLKAEAERVATIVDDVQRRAEAVEAGLEMVRSGVHTATEQLKKELENLKNSVFRITAISVSADAKAIAAGEDIDFAVVGEIGGNEKRVSVKWSPVKPASSLFKSIVDAAFQ
ncbi:hypothetical protein OQA88_8021 [Cercophora sp. LCS_1]